MQPPARYDEIVTRVTAASGAPQVRLTRHPVAELGLDLLRVDVVPQAFRRSHTWGCLAASTATSPPA